MCAFRGGFVIMDALVAGKGMVDAGIAVAGYVRVSGKAFFDGRLRGLVDKFILLSNMQDCRRRYVGCQVQLFMNANAVIADIAIGIGPAGHEIGQQAAQAEPDRSHLATATVNAAQMRQRRFQVLDALFDIEPLIQFEGSWRQNRSGLMAI
jgi:hypothetical protein